MKPFTLDWWIKMAIKVEMKRIELTSTDVFGFDDDRGTKEYSLKLAKYRIMERYIEERINEYN